MTEKSKEALIQSLPEHNTQKDVILALIEKGINSLGRLSKIRDCLPYSMSDRSLTGRLSDLYDEGRIKPTPEEDGRYTVWAVVTNESEREHIKQLRRIEKYRAWVKRGEQDFADFIPSRVMLELTMIEI